MDQTRTFGIRAVALVLCLTLSGPAVASAQDKDGPRKTELKTQREPGQAEQRLARLVREELVTLPYYTVFDNLIFQVDGSTVELLGQVSRPALKSDADGVIRRIEGVDKVVNNIEVLPASPTDDHIRRNVYRAIYQHPTMAKYAIQALPPIHIIVKNGKVFLEGLVASESDKNIANTQANSVSGVVSVTSNLLVEKIN